MAKYSYEFKIKAIQAYLNGEGSYEYLAKKYNISDQYVLKVWVKSYKLSVVELSKGKLLR